MFDKLRFWFFDTFGTRTTQKTYIGHGDYTEEPGWIFRKRFVPVNPNVNSKNRGK
jgi:hypothetical protein